MKKQVVDVSFLKLQEEIMEVVQHAPQEFVMNRVREQIVAACQIQEESVQTRVEEQLVDVPVLQLQEEIVTAVQHTPLELVMIRSRLQIVALPVPQIKEQIVALLGPQTKEWEIVSVVQLTLHELVPNATRKQNRGNARSPASRKMP